MTTQEANQLLDDRREGANFPCWLVDKALEATGDLEPVPEPVKMSYTNVVKMYEHA
jgi:hypothetical protein